MHEVISNDLIASPRARSVGVPRRWVLTALVPCVASATLLASTPGARAEAAGADAEARAMLPEALRTAGVLHVGMETNYAPYQYQVGGKAEGMDADLIRAVAAKLGLNPQFAFVEFPAILPAVQSGRFDVGANFANTVARRKVVSFVNYLGFAAGVLVQKGNPQKVDAKNLCGRHISTGVGSFSYFNTKSMSDQCVKDGKPPITIVPMPAADGINALRAGRVDGTENDAIAVIYTASQPAGQDLEALVLPNVLKAPTLGYITNNDRDGVALAHAMAAALNAMIRNGEYATILGKWKVPDELLLKEAFAN